MQLKTEKKAKFWNKIAEKYSKDPITNPEAYEIKLKRTRELLTKNSVVLELGCGTGTTAIKHSPFVKNIVAADISENMIRIAKERAAEAKVTNIDFQCKNLEELSLQAESFDMVMAHSLLHLIEDRKQALDFIYKSLKPKGYFISSTACIADFIPFFGPIGSIGYSLGYLPLVRSFRASHLISEIEEAGFAIDFSWQPSKKEALFIIARKS